MTDLDAVQPFRVYKFLPKKGRYSRFSLSLNMDAIPRTIPSVDLPRLLFQSINLSSKFDFVPVWLIFPHSHTWNLPILLIFPTYIAETKRLPGMGSVSNNGQFASTIKTEPEDLTAYVQQVRAQALQKQLDGWNRMSWVYIDNTESAQPLISGEFCRC